MSSLCHFVSFNMLIYRSSVSSSSPFFVSEDTPFGQVKLGELPAWLSRRSKNPVDWGRAVSRAYWRWQHAHVMPRNAGITWVIQGVAGLSVLFYILNSDKIRELMRHLSLLKPLTSVVILSFAVHHKLQKYHW